MKKYFSLLLFTLASVSLFGGPRSVEQMIESASKIISKRPMKTSPKDGRHLEILKEGQMFSVIGYKDGGFAIIASDDRFAPVLGYSETQFPTDDMPPALQWWMNVAETSMIQSIEKGETVQSGAELRAYEYPDAVPELLTTKWDQGTPFNKELVSLTGKNYPTGCMATAMAQIMKFHSWPITGYGYKGYAIDGKNKNYDFESTTYDYENMIDVYARGNYTDEQADAVAKLMIHCGVAVDMNYTLQGSGSLSNDAAVALSDYFRYSTRLYTREIYSKSDWMNMIFDELSGGRPILYGGVTPQYAGHAFVFDGYSADGLVHVNWGWGGSGNGYYDVAILNSEQGSFSLQQDMIVMHDAEAPLLTYESQWGIYPSITWTTSGGNTFETIGKFEASLSNNLLTFVCSNLTNCDVTPFTGKLSLLAEPENGGNVIELKTETLNGFDYYQVYPSNANDYKGTVNVSSLTDGTYKIYLASKANTEISWQPVHYNESINGTYLLTKKNGSSQLTTGIENVILSKPENTSDGRIYSIDGRYMGTDAAVLKSGMYIMNGRKFVKQ